ncbi:MAG TPA: hypothetical protein VIF10_02470 [Methylobacter sp.]
MPTDPIVGVKLVMTGGALRRSAVTVKGLALDAVFRPTVTLMSPVVAPVGAVVISFVGLAELTAAATPLNVIALLAAVALNPTP